MISIGNWSIKIIPEDKRINRFHNYKELFLIYYKGSLCGTIQICDFDKKYWVRILDEKIRKRFYDDDKKFCVQKIIKTKNGDYLTQKQNYVLAETLARLYYLDTETKRSENDFYSRVVIDGLFDKEYKTRVKTKKILQDIKKECVGIENVLSNKEIKKSIIEIFQVQNLVLNLHLKSCKNRKSWLFWEL